MDGILTQTTFWKRHLLILVDRVKDFNFWFRPTASNIVDPHLYWVHLYLSGMCLFFLPISRVWLWTLDKTGQNCPSSTYSSSLSSLQHLDITGRPDHPVQHSSSYSSPRLRLVSRPGSQQLHYFTHQRTIQISSRWAINYSVTWKDQIVFWSGIIFFCRRKVLQPSKIWG